MPGGPGRVARMKLAVQAAQEVVFNLKPACRTAGGPRRPFKNQVRAGSHGCLTAEPSFRPTKPGKPQANLALETMVEARGGRRGGCRWGAHALCVGSLGRFRRGGGDGGIPFGLPTPSAMAKGAKLPERPPPC